MQEFGIGSPKFVWHKGLADEKTVSFDHVNVLKDEPEKDLIYVQAEIGGSRKLWLQGKHWIYQIRMHLHQYSEPWSKYTEVKAMEGEEGILYRHNDGPAFLDKDSNEALFFVESIDESYLDDTTYKDLLIITFKSVEYVHLPRTATPRPQLSEIIMSSAKITG